MSPVKPKFDILSWWKENQRKYRVLSQIAHDVLDIQVSIVSSKSTFSTSGWILDPFRSSLSPKMVEALIFTQNWARSSHERIQFKDYLDELQTYEHIESDNNFSLSSFFFFMFILLVINKYKTNIFFILFVFLECGTCAS